MAARRGSSAVNPGHTRHRLRLYQAEHLLRDYGFRFEELAFEADGNLSLDDDPKTAWAHAHPELARAEPARSILRGARQEAHWRATHKGP